VVAEEKSRLLGSMLCRLDAGTCIGHHTGSWGKTCRGSNERFPAVAGWLAARWHFHLMSANAQNPYERMTGY